MKLSKEQNDATHFIMRSALFVLKNKKIIK